MCLSVPGQIVEIAEAHGLRMGRVDFGGIIQPVCLEYVTAGVGEWVLVHVGFALTTLSSDDAAEIKKMLGEITSIAEDA